LKINIQIYSTFLGFTEFIIELIPSLPNSFKPHEKISLLSDNTKQCSYPAEILIIFSFFVKFIFINSQLNAKFSTPKTLLAFCPYP
jgi:hypothetical protein